MGTISALGCIVQYVCRMCEYPPGSGRWHRNIYLAAWLRVMDRLLGWARSRDSKISQLHHRHHRHHRHHHRYGSALPSFPSPQSSQIEMEVFIPHPRMTWLPDNHVRSSDTCFAAPYSNASLVHSQAHKGTRVNGLGFKTQNPTQVIINSEVDETEPSQASGLCLSPPVCAKVV